MSTNFIRRLSWIFSSFTIVSYDQFATGKSAPGVPKQSALPFFPELGLLKL
jgi:hypothetical protein